MKEQIEVYKILLKGNPDDTFGKYISEKFGKVTGNRPVDVFDKIFKELIKHIDKKVYENNATSQAITVLKNRNEPFNNILTPHSATFVIEGYIDGGYYNLMRRLTDKTNISHTSDITKNNMVADRYYIYMQLKPEQNVGILMIEKKGNLSISRTVIKMIEGFLKITNNRKCRVERFFPNYLIQEFKQGAVVDSITCSDQLLTQVQGHGIVNRDSHYEVTIKIKPLDAEDQSSDSGLLRSVLNNVNLSFFGNGFNLSGFSKKKGSFKTDTGGTLKFELDNENNINPIIPIPEDLLSENKDILLRERIKATCDDILDKLQREVYAYN